MTMRKKQHAAEAQVDVLQQQLMPKACYDTRHGTSTRNVMHSLQAWLPVTAISPWADASC
jgi:hypothetical protein